MADGQVIIDILADDKEYQKTVTALNDYTSKSLDVTAKTFSAVGKGMTAAITAPILAVGAFSIKAAIDFESSFAGVRKTTEATEAEFERLAQDAKDMSETKVVSANQINDIMALGSQLGILKENLTDFSSTIADLDVATNLNAEEAATQIAQYANITKMAQTDTDRFGSTIVELGNNMATTEPDIMAFAMRIAGAGSQVGMTDAEILALSGSLASVGLGAEAGGTAISTIMSQIDKDVAQNSESLLIWASTANMSVDQFAAAWQDNALGALQALLKGMDEATASGGNMNLMLDELGISSLRQTDAMKRMSNAADLLSGSVDTANNAWQSNTALANEAAARYMTTESQMAILQNKMTNIASTLGGPLLGSVNALIDGAEPFIGILRDAATGFAEMDDGQRNLIVGAALLAAGLGPIALVGSKILTMTKNVTEGYRGLVAAQKAVTVATAAGTAATTASGAATGYLALATANDTAAKAVNATATGALAAVQRIATVTQHALNAAMAANPVGVVLAGILLLIGALGTLAFVMDNTKTKQERLTRASEQHRGKVVELTRAYEDAAASNGEFSNEAMAAKAALDEETAAFEASKQTLADFVKECDELVEAHQKLMGEIHETVGAA
ncbi:MAG: phage tail tape measure protein, partial [Coriobacteriales bacterium]|nr:phage tail tape measure protein [Coriobacteriales bacterium]